jgi:hypothetical protein
MYIPENISSCITSTLMLCVVTIHPLQSMFSKRLLHHQAVLNLYLTMPNPVQLLECSMQDVWLYVTSSMVKVGTPM